MSSRFNVGVIEFHITCTLPESPLTSEMLINNVTTGVNGSSIYCSDCFIRDMFPAQLGASLDNNIILHCADPFYILCYRLE